VSAYVVLIVATVIGAALIAYWAYRRFPRLRKKGGRRY
jgi:hypothetical protein